MVKFLKSVFQRFFEFFLAKDQNIFKGRKICNYDEETGYFEKNTVSKKASVPKTEGAKSAGGSRPSCFLTITLSCRIM